MIDTIVTLAIGVPLVAFVWTAAFVTIRDIVRGEEK